MSAIRFARQAAAFGAAVTLLGACGNPTGGDDHEEPNVAGVVITVGTNTVTLGPTGQSGTLSLATGVSHAATVRVLNAGGADDQVVAEHSDEYEIRMTQAASSGATTDSRFTQSGTGYPFTGTITTGATTGPAVYRVSVYSKEHGHEEGHGFLNLTVTASTVN